MSDPWPPALLLPALIVARSTQESLKAAAAQGCARARAADPQDLPAVVHQLLVLSTRGCRDFILQARSGLLV